MNKLRLGLAINIWLLLMVVGTALLLVRWQYESRRLYVQLDKSDHAHKQLSSDNARLVAEKRQLSAPARTERVAAQSLGMRPADASVTVYSSQSSAGAKP